MTVDGLGAPSTIGLRSNVIGFLDPNDVLFY